MSKCKPLPVTQPEDWWEAFKRQASLEGMTLSEWVGQACLKSLPFGDEADWTVANAIEAHGLSQRPRRGNVKGGRGKAKEPGPEVRPGSE